VFKNERGNSIWRRYLTDLELSRKTARDIERKEAVVRVSNNNSKVLTNKEKGQEKRRKRVPIGINRDDVEALKQTVTDAFALIRKCNAAAVDDPVFRELSMQKSDVKVPN
jgi:hypothetical protein